MTHRLGGAPSLEATIYAKAPIAMRLQNSTGRPRAERSPALVRVLLCETAASPALPTVELGQTQPNISQICELLVHDCVEAYNG
jgi:hypothetical protein